MKERECCKGLLNRIVRESQVPDLLQTLSDRLSPTDLQSLLLEVHRRQTARLSPADVLRQYRENRFVRLAQSPASDFVELDRLAFSLLPVGFDALELSPVCPLGTCSVLAPVDQNKTLSTVRNTEVCADSTNVLALEAATRRQRASRTERRSDTKLCASHRLLRTQVFQAPASFPHFRVFSLVTAGRDRGTHQFEAQALSEHIDFYLRLLKESHSIGYHPALMRVAVTPFNGGDAGMLKEQVQRLLAERHPGVDLLVDLDRQAGRGYYQWAGFQIFATDPQGEPVFLADGGFTDWTARLLSDRKERLLISAIGTERFVACFRTPAT